MFTTEQVQHGRVQIEHAGRLLDRLETKVVGGAVGGPAARRTRVPPLGNANGQSPASRRPGTPLASETSLQTHSNTRYCTWFDWKGQRGR